MEEEVNYEEDEDEYGRRMKKEDEDEYERRSKL